jgi:uncharacterized membrane protein required for colicin V production
MIGAAAAAAQPAQMSMNWFDGVAAIVLAVGVFQGRRNGMARELLPLLQWICAMLVSAFGCSMVEPFFMNTMGLTKVTAYVMAYLFLMFLIVAVFISFRRKFTERLTKAEFFHSSEYYLGMLSGLVRCACILIILLALLNAPVYSESEIQSHAAYVKQTYGGGMYNGDFFPTVQEVQEQVFAKSFTGPLVKKYLAPLLIQTADVTPPAKPKQ